MKTNPDDLINDTKNSLMGTQGLTKREYFAALALPGYIAAGSFYPVKHAVEAADALIKELNKDKNE